MRVSANTKVLSELGVESVTSSHVPIHYPLTINYLITSILCYTLSTINYLITSILCYTLSTINYLITSILCYVSKDL